MWGNLLTGLVAGFVALSGVIYTQSRADSRERERWERERAHEREVWSRDDAARSYDQRRETYLTYLNDYEEMGDLVWRGRTETEPFVGNPEPPDDLLAPLYRRVGAIQVFGTRAAFDRATEAYKLLSRWVFGSAEQPSSWEDVTAARDAYVDQVRRDLHVSDE